MYLQIKRAVMALCLCLTCMIAFAQRQVTGSVTDPLGKPLIGVNVVVDGTSIGSVTDINGNFTISRVPAEATIKLSYIGYREQKIKLGTQANYYITMHEDNQNLDELIVIGYQAVKKRDVTGAVASVRQQELQNVSASNALLAMQGSVPGVNLSQVSGEAGGKVKINLRGTRSMVAENDPLILVDGVDYGTTIDINPSDIESIDVLKDASSTAIYGTRGANGVIIITTKHGQAGKTHVTLGMYNSWNSATSYLKTIYGDAEVKFKQDNANYASNYNNYVSTGTWGTNAATVEEVLGDTKLADGTKAIDIYNDKSYTNWTDYFIKNSTSQNYNIGVNGGSDKTTFAISLGMLDDRGLMNKDALKRYTGIINIDHKVNDYLKFGGSLNYSYKDQDKRNAGVYNQYLKMTTITHPYLNTGAINATPNPGYSSHCSPLLDDVDGAFQHNFETTRFFGHVYAEIFPIRNVTYHAQLALDRQDVREGLYEDYESQPRYQSPSTSYISATKSSLTTLTLDNTLKYNSDFSGSRHSLDVVFGNEVIQTVNESSSIYGEAGTDHYYESAFYNTQNITKPTTGNTYTKTRLLSFFGRLNYSFADKYLFSATVRADGSSVLAENKKWGYFPSMAAGWRVTEEPWMLMTSSWLSNLKLRASWGISGNAAVQPYQTQGAFSSGNYYYYMGEDGTMKDYPGKFPTSISNNSLTWEKTSTFDIGLDFGLYNGRINCNIDYYTNHSYDVLFYKVAPPSSVFTSVLSNVGKTKGSGIEIGVDADAVRVGDFDWNVNFNYTHFSDEITAFSGNVKSYQISKSGQYLILGERLHTYYDYKANNTWAIGEYKDYVNSWKSRHNGETPTYSAHYGDPGTPKIVDTNDDGVIDDKDRVVYNMDPEHILSLINTLTYKGLSLSFQMYASIGGYIKYGLSDDINFENGVNWADVDYWTPENQHAKYPSPGLTSDQQYLYTQYKSALQYEKADFFKIKDITLSYNFPNKIINKFNVSGLRVYGSLKNFITLSGIDNYDPERGGAISFPLQKQAVVGINVEF